MSSQNIVDTDLLPGYSQFKRGSPDVSLSTYAHSAVSIDQLFAVAALLWPAIRSYEGGLFLADDFSIDSYNGFLEQNSGNLTLVEETMNHRHVRDLLDSLYDAPDQIVMSAAILIRDCWTYRLRSLYPDTPTQVILNSAQPDNIILTFSCNRNHSA